MTSIKSRAVAGKRSSSRAAKPAAGGTIRSGLLGSTALVAVGLAASGAMAQTYNPAGGGTIVISGSGTTTDNTGSGGGFQNLEANSRTIDGVSITNTTGSPSASAINFTRTTFSGSGDGLTFNGTNTLVAAAGGNAITLSSTGGNNTGIGFNGTLNATGLNGVAVSTLGDLYQGGAGSLNLTAQTPGSGSGLLWTAANSIGDVSLSGAFSATNFQYGANLTATTGYINFTTGTGGAITGATTGIRAQATTGVDVGIGSSIAATTTGISATTTAGAVSVTATGAITAATGISTTAVSGSTVTTSGGGTINSTSNGVGTGIIATSSGGTTLDPFSINVGAAIGNTTAPLTGVDARNTGTGTVSVTNTAAVTATGIAIYSSSAATAGNVLNLNANVTGGVFAVNTVGQGYTVNVGAASTVTGSGTNSRALIMQSGAGVVVNSGTIRNLSGDANSAIQFSQAGTVTNTGTISYVGNQLGAISANSGLSVTNSGTISSTGAQQVAILSSGNGTFATSVTNQAGGSIVGLIGLYNSGSGLNTLDLQAGSTTGGVRSWAGGATTANIAGSLTGAYDASVGTGATTLTLAAGGSMQGATFGSASDTFIWQGGTIGGVINAGTGTNAFSSALGMGSGTLNLSNITNFQTLTHQSGTATLSGASASPFTTILAGTGVPSGTLIFNGTSGLTSAITVNGAVVRATTAGGFGTGTITMLDPTIEYGATGTYANNILLSVASPASADPSTFRADAGITATLSGSLTRGGGDTAQPVVIGGLGTIVLTNSANSWTGSTTVNAGATLQGTAATISGSSIITNGVLQYTATGTVSQAISGTGALTASGGVLTLTGSNIWSGLTTVNSGVTLSGTTGSIAGSSIVNNGTLTYTNTTAGTATQNISGSGQINVSGLGAGQALTFAGTLTNANGIDILDGSAIVIAGDMTATNGPAIASNAAGISVTNLGTMSADAGSPLGTINLGLGGTILNGSASNTTASITGGYAAIYNTGGALIVTNYGALDAAGYGIVAQGGNGASPTSLTLVNSGRITGGDAAVVANDTTTSNSVTNTSTGLIRGVNYGATLRGTSTVNNSGDMVGGVNGLWLIGTSTTNLITNSGRIASGTIAGNAQGGAITVSGGSGVELAGGTINNLAGGQILGNTAGINSSAGNLSVTNGGQISGVSGIRASGGAATIVNAGTVTGSGTTVSTGGIVTGAGGSITNQAGGQVTGAIGIQSTGGTLALTNSGTITGTNVGLAGVNTVGSGSVITNHATIRGGAQAVLLNNGGTVHNLGASSVLGTTNTAALTDASGIYSSGALTLTNEGTISTASTGASHGVQVLGVAAITNTGSITAANGSGVFFNGGGSSLVNSGTVTGGASASIGYGVQNAAASGLSTITNQAGGVIGGGAGSILLNGAGNTTIDLQAGSTTTGQILSNAGGTHTVTIAGALNGAYNAATGSGIDILTLTSTGSITGAVSLGAGNDTFNWQGGTIGSTIDGGTGTADVFNSVLGTGVSGSLSLSNLSNFETYNHQSGTLTLTGSRTGGAVWTLAAGTILNVAGSLSNVGGTGFGITANGAATVNVLEAGVLNNWVGIYFNSASTSTVANAGAITATQAGITTSSGPVNVTNASTGTISSSASDAIRLGYGPSTITNSGVITGSTTGYGVNTTSGATTVNNNAGTISGGTAGLRMGLVSGTSYGGLLTVTNAAGAQITGGTGIETVGTGALTLNNSGRVLGGANGAIVANGSGVVSITNNAGGQIVASGGNAISSIGTATITNAGLIGNGTVDGGGVYTAGGTGYAINIAGGTITNSGTITGGSSGVFSSNGLTLTNTGTITGDSGLQVGLYRDAVTVLNAPATILNAGTISAPVFSAVLIQGGTVTNAAAGSMTGGTDSTYGVAVQFSATGGTFTNYGSATGAGAGGVRVNDPGAATTITLHAGSTTGAILLNGGNDTLSIYNGRGTDSLATVDGTSGITLQNAGTLAAASVGAIDMGGGTNTLVLAGTGDGTAANGAAGTMFNGSTSGVSDLSKIDSGLWTLTGSGTYTGTTTVSGGTLRVLDTGDGLGEGAVSIASGATLNFDNQTGGLINVEGNTFTGAGRLLFTGSNADTDTALGNGGNGNVMIALSQGGLIDVQSGRLLGSSSVQGFWTNNLGSLNIAAGARFDTVEGLVRVDALTGAGALAGGYDGTVPLTVGVAGGSGTFSGTITDNLDFAHRYLALTKVGAGTQTLSGTNTYTGQTSIEGGTLEVRNGSAIDDFGVVSVSSGATFLVSNAETIGRLSGAGAVNLAGGSLTLADSSGTYSGALSGVGSLVLSGGSLSLGGALTNAGGLVQGGTTAASLLSTGSITVAGNAVTMTGTANSLTNAGTVSSSGGTGVTAAGAMTLVNTAGGTISGQTGVYAAGVGTVTNAAGASITAGSLNNTVRLAGNGSSLTNAGTISGTTNFAGVFFDGSGTVTNQAGGLISNTSTAVQFAGAGSVLDNAGTISNTNAYSAVYFGDSGSVVNRAGGGIAGDSWGVQINGANGAVSNAGSITAGARAVHLTGANATLGNSGVISGGQHGVVSLGTATVSNDLGGAIAGTIYSAVYVGGAGSTVTNAGLMTGGNAAIYVTGAGTAVTNTGTIRITGGSDNTVVSGVYSSAGGTTVTNSGQIDSSLDGGRGIYLAGGTGAITNQSGGTIAGNGTGAAILLTGAGYTLDLQAGSTVDGLIDASAATGLNTVTLGGTLNGGYAGGTGADDIMLTGGMSVSGLIDGGTGTDALILGGAIDGSLDISQTTGFESRTMNGTGVWTLSGTDDGSADWTLNSGTLRLSGGQSINSWNVVQVNSGATLSVGDSEAINALNGAGSVVIDGNQTLWVGSHGGDSLFSGVISGAGGLSQSGAGSLTLSGANTYTGDTRVNSGTLRLGGDNVIADASRLIVERDAILDLNGFNDTVAVALLNGTVNSTVGAPGVASDQAQVIPALDTGGKGSDGPLTLPVATGTGTLTAGEYQLNGATVNANLGTGNLFNTGGVSTLNGTAAAGSVSVQTGTLVLGASNRLADTATVSVSTGATLDLQAFNDTVGLALLNGTLAGTGSLTAAQYQLSGATVNANLGAGSLFHLGGTSVLNGTAAANAVSVQAGTLRLGALNRLADTAMVSVSNGATFDVNGRTETIGALYGTGTVAIGAGQLSFGGADSAFGGSVSGSGSLVHTSGLFTLMGSHTLATLRNTGGELRFVGATTGGVAVSGGSLTGAGTIGGALAVSGGATLSPGLAGQANGLGTFSAGSLTLNGATLVLDVLGTAGGNQIDRVAITGTATLTGGTVAPTFSSPANGYDFSTRYQFLSAGQLVGTFSNGTSFTAAPAQSGLFWRVRYDLAPNTAVLELRNLVDFDLGTSGTGNQNAVARALTGGQLQASDDWAAVLGLTVDMNTAQRQAAFNSMGGEALADMSTTLLSANDAFMEAVRDAGAARNPGTAPLSFGSAFSFVGGRDGTAAMVTGVLDAFDPSAAAGTSRGGWVSVQASDIDLEGKNGQADLQTRLNGFSGGYAVGTGDYVVGAAAGATRVEGDVFARQSSFESDVIHAAGYARFDDGRWAASLTASIYEGELDSARTVTVGAFTGQALGRTHGEGGSVSAGIARRFVDDSGGSVSVGLMETISRSTLDAFTETGAGGLSLEVADQERNWQTTQVNLRGTQDYRVNGQPLRLYGGLGVLVTTGDREALADMRFSGAATGFGGFTVEGAQAAPLAAVTEFGLEYQPREGLTLSTGYRAVLSDRLNDNQIGARLSVVW